MSFQLSGGERVALPQLPVQPTPAIAAEAPAPLPVNAPVAGGLHTTSIDEYHSKADVYKKACADYPRIDDESAEWRSALDVRSSVLRAKFERLGVELDDLHVEYSALRDHDDLTYEMREASYDALIEAYNSLKPDDRKTIEYHPSYPIVSQVTKSDTSIAFRDEDGKLTAPITTQASDRTPDWLDTFTDVVGAVLDGWKARSDDAIAAAHPTNELQRSRAAVAKAVHHYAKVHMSETWKPAVMLGPGETLKQNVDCSYNWDDMYDPEAKEEPLVHNALGDIAATLVADNEEIFPFESNVPELARTPEEPLGTEGLETVAMEALVDIGNTVESQLRLETIKQLSAHGADEIAARASRLAGVEWFK